MVNIHRSRHESAPGVWSDDREAQRLPDAHFQQQTPEGIHEALQQLSVDIEQGSVASAKKTIEASEAPSDDQPSFEDIVYGPVTRRSTYRHPK